MRNTRKKTLEPGFGVHAICELLPALGFGFSLFSRISSIWSRDLASRREGGAGLGQGLQADHRTCEMLPHNGIDSESV